jgi:hypothetical protein
LTDHRSYYDFDLSISQEYDEVAAMGITSKQGQQLLNMEQIQT